MQGSDADIGTDIMEGDGQQLDVIQSSQKRSNGRLLRQISAQRLYDLPSILKMRVSLHQPVVANGSYQCATLAEVPSVVIFRRDTIAVNTGRH